VWDCLDGFADFEDYLGDDISKGKYMGLEKASEKQRAAIKKMRDQELN
jgi:hypothetical protein